MLEQIGAFDKLNVILVEHQRAGHQALEVEHIRKVFERCRECSDRVELLRFGEFAFVACEAIVDAERQQGHLLRDHHQWAGDVQRVVAVVEKGAMQMDQRQVDERNNHNQSVSNDTD